MARKRDRKKREQKKRERGRRSKTMRRQAKEPDRSPERNLLETSAEKGKQVADDYLRRDDPSARVVELADALRELVLRDIQQSPVADQRECRPGCDPCCHTAVTVAAPEAVAIAAYLRDHYGEEELRAVREHMDRNAALASSMTRKDYIAKSIPCALRTPDGHCRVHPVRPIACAGFHSTSRAACGAEFNRVFNRGPVPTDDYAMLVGLGVSHGLADACKQAGLDGTFYEIHHALRRVIDTPDAAEKWACGQGVFDGCLR